MRLTASAFEMTPSSTMSTAIRTAAAAVRLASRVWSMYRLPRSIVNSRSWTFAVVLLELLADALELVVHGRHVARKLADRRRRAHPGDDVLALGVGQVLAEQLPLAGVRVAGERHAGARVVAHVPEDHGHRR